MNLNKIELSSIIEDLNVAGGQMALLLSTKSLRAKVEKIIIEMYLSVFSYL